jgi:hypothetical protein
MKWTHARYAVEMRDEPTYTFSSTDNPRSYQRELLLTCRDSVTSRHGVVLLVDGAPVASLMIGAGAGPTGVHERSALLVGGACFVAVGSELVCLAVPSFHVRWHREADPATSVGVHLSPDDGAVVVHGELEISKWSQDGRRIWSFGGADIFAGALSIVGGTVLATDFEGRAYRIDLGSGNGELGSA